MRITMQNGTDIAGLPRYLARNIQNRFFDELKIRMIGKFGNSYYSLHRSIRYSESSMIYPLIRKIFVQIPPGASTNQRMFQLDVSASELIRRLLSAHNANTHCHLLPFYSYLLSVYLLL